ncbi:MAG: prepilin-type N-terminal cleavage/methylation domain-containing protein [bacterium]|nr:prepilin-type N-terminal cleavage/methylation domain-containing protein [bacterium]
MQNLKPKTYNLKPNKGFTLIEILIVVGIIGILSSVILVGLNSSRSRARDSRRITDLRQTQQGLELYYTKSGEYPDTSSWANLQTELEGASIGVRKVPEETLTGHDPYEYAGDGQNYVLKAYLEDPSENLTKDSITGFSIDGVGCDEDEDEAFCVAS